MPTRESFHLGMAKRAYVDGSLTLEEFKQSVEHVLRGGTLNAAGRIPQYVTITRTVIESPYAKA